MALTLKSWAKTREATSAPWQSLGHAGRPWRHWACGGRTGANHTHHGFSNRSQSWRSRDASRKKESLRRGSVKTPRPSSQVAILGGRWSGASALIPRDKAERPRNVGAEAAPSTRDPESEGGVIASSTSRRAAEPVDGTSPWLTRPSCPRLLTGAPTPAPHSSCGKLGRTITRRESNTSRVDRAVRGRTTACACGAFEARHPASTEATADLVVSEVTKLRVVRKF